MNFSNYIKLSVQWMTWTLLLFIGKLNLEKEIWSMQKRLSLEIHQCGLTKQKKYHCPQKKFQASTVRIALDKNVFKKFLRTHRRKLVLFHCM